MFQQRYRGEGGAGLHELACGRVHVLPYTTSCESDLYFTYRPEPLASARIPVRPSAVNYDTRRLAYGAPQLV